MSALDQNGLLFGNLARFLLRNHDMQNAVFIRRLNVLFRQVFTHEEAALHHARIALLTEHLALLVLLVLLQRFLRRDGQITIVQFKTDLILLEAGQINVYFVAVLCLFDVRLHQILCVLAVQSVIDVAKAAEEVAIKIVKNVHKVLAENSRKIVAHNANLHSFGLAPLVRMPVCRVAF